MNKSVSIMTRLQAELLGFNFWQGQRFFSLHHHVEIGNRAHPASYPVTTRGSFPRDKAARV